jgi:FlgN protein
VNRILDHMTRQLASSRRLLEIVLSQNAAIRRQDTEAVLASLSDVQAEMAYRAQLETEREVIFRNASTQHGVTADVLDLESLLVGMPAEEAAEARSLSAELVGLVREIGRIHEQNRVLLRQELAFLDHLMRAMSGTPQGGYTPTGWAGTRAAVNTVDARA